MKEHSDKKRYYIIIAIIAIVAFALSAGNFEFSYFLRLFLGILFLTMGTLKIYNLENFVDVFSNYDLLAMRFKAYRYLYPFIELFIGAFYLFNLFTFATNLMVIIIFSVGAYGVWQALRDEEEQIYCACLGDVVRLPLDRTSLFEDLFLVAIALFLLVS